MTANQAAPGGGRSDRTLRLMVGICATILITLLREGRPVFTPLAFALLVIAIVWPVQRTLQAKLPKLVALASYFEDH